MALGDKETEKFSFDDARSGTGSIASMIYRFRHASPTSREQRAKNEPLSMGSIPLWWKKGIEISKSPSAMRRPITPSGGRQAAVRSTGRELRFGSPSSKSTLSRSPRTPSASDGLRHKRNWGTDKMEVSRSPKQRSHTEVGSPIQSPTVRRWMRILQAERSPSSKSQTKRPLLAKKSSRDPPADETSLSLGENTEYDAHQELELSPSRFEGLTTTDMHRFPRKYKGSPPSSRIRSRSMSPSRRVKEQDRIVSQVERGSANVIDHLIEQDLALIAREDGGSSPSHNVLLDKRKMVEGPAPDPQRANTNPISMDVLRDFYFVDNFPGSHILGEASGSPPIAAKTSIHHPGASLASRFLRSKCDNISSQGPAPEMRPDTEDSTSTSVELEALDTLAQKRRELSKAAHDVIGHMQQVLEEFKSSQGESSQGDSVDFLPDRRLECETTLSSEVIDRNGAPIGVFEAKDHLTPAIVASELETSLCAINTKFADALTAQEKRRTAAATSQTMGSTASTSSLGTIFRALVPERATTGIVEDMPSQDETRLEWDMEGIPAPACEPCRSSGHPSVYHMVSGIAEPEELCWHVVEPPTGTGDFDSNQCLLPKEKSNSISNEGSAVDVVVAELASLMKEELVAEKHAATLSHKLQQLDMKIEEQKQKMHTLRKKDSKADDMGRDSAPFASTDNVGAASDEIAANPIHSTTSLRGAQNLGKRRGEIHMDLKETTKEIAGCLDLAILTLRARLGIDKKEREEQSIRNKIHEELKAKTRKKQEELRKQEESARKLDSMAKALVAGSGSIEDMIQCSMSVCNTVPRISETDQNLIGSSRRDCASAHRLPFRNVHVRQPEEEGSSGRPTTYHSQNTTPDWERHSIGRFQDALCKFDTILSSSGGNTARQSLAYSDPDTVYGQVYCKEMSDGEDEAFSAHVIDSLDRSRRQDKLHLPHSGVTVRDEHHLHANYDSIYFVDLSRTLNLARQLRQKKADFFDRLVQRGTGHHCTESSP